MASPVTHGHRRLPAYHHRPPLTTSEHRRSFLSLAPSGASHPCASLLLVAQLLCTSPNTHGDHRSLTSTSNCRRPPSQRYLCSPPLKTLLTNAVGLLDGFLFAKPPPAKFPTADNRRHRRPHRSSPSPAAVERPPSSLLSLSSFSFTDETLNPLSLLYLPLSPIPFILIFCFVFIIIIFFFFVFLIIYVYIIFLFYYYF